MTSPPEPSRFPVAAAAICAVCVAFAGWAWMRWSFAWNADALDRDGLCSWEGRYVILHGCIERPSESGAANRADVAVALTGGEAVLIRESYSLSLLGLRAVHQTDRRVVRGRLVLQPVIPLPFMDSLPPPAPVLDLGAGRLTWQSIVGLVVGLGGIGMVAFFLHRWRGGRSPRSD